MIDLIDLVRSIAAEAARAEESTNYPMPCTPGSPLLATVRQACVERGFTASGVAVSVTEPQVAVARWAARAQPVLLPSPHFALVAAVNGFRKAILDSRYSAGDHHKLMLEAQDRIFAEAQVAPARLRYATSAAADVLAERRRQQVSEGWSVERDDNYTRQQLPSAAMCYALHNDPTWAPTAWPWADVWWKPTNPRQNCVKAAALLIAEIERIDRAAVAASKAGV